MTQKTAIVTGANRGLGFEISRQLAQAGYHVILCARDLASGGDALKTLQAENLSVELRRVDVSNTEQTQSLADYLRENNVKIDVLINNAGILPETSKSIGAKSADPLLVSPVTVMEILNVNTLGPLRLIQAVAPHMPAGSRIVNIASWMGQFKRLEGRHLGYRMSKTALNAITGIMAKRLEEDDIQVHSVCPGWVRTSMGGKNADLPVEEAAANVVWVATSEEVTDSGKFWRNRKQIEW
ncbi:MAG TPA: SDR family NAD(P)-dependent oxidoreductase [Gammaproteobacteria bacterium]|nr:SDR family NAD(P)-dependent oxidoreductase [Gammaproteobacteria bacterium]